MSDWLTTAIHLANNPWATQSDGEVLGREPHTDDDTAALAIAAITGECPNRDVVRGLLRPTPADE